MSNSSWIGIEANWASVKYKDGSMGYATDLLFRQQRLPWLKNQKKLVVGIHPHSHMLHIYKLEYVPKDPLSPNDMLIIIKSTDAVLQAVSDYFDWPAAEAATRAFTGIDLANVIPKRQMATVLIREFNKKPIADWWPVHRGDDGVCFLRDIQLQNKELCCLELRPDGVCVRSGQVRDNATLSADNVIQRFNIHQLEVNTLLDAYWTGEDLVQCRILARRLRNQIFNHIWREELPF